MSSQSPQPIPQKIGPYPIECLLGKGGMSLVYLGVQPETHDPLIIKVLSHQFLSRKDVVERFLKEAEIVAMTDHPNIVKWYDHGEWEGGLYIALEYVTGVSLRKYMQQHPISLRRALEIIIEISYALCHLHTHGVIHRDLKPENILIADNGLVKVIDFGISQLLTERESITDSSKIQLVGTLAYMSPEQQKNPHAVSYPSDIYSLGIIAYELILGRSSHGKVHIGLMPPSLQKIISKTLQPNPEDRYGDVVDFISDLSAYLHSPAIEKEFRTSDLISSLSEELQHAQQFLVPHKLPDWPNLEVRAMDEKQHKLYGYFKDFWELPQNRFAVVTAFPCVNGVESFLWASLFKGLSHSLPSKMGDSLEKIQELQQSLKKCFGHPVFHLNYLMLDPEKNQLTYMAFGFGRLWHATNQGITLISCDNALFGSSEHHPFNFAVHSWEPGDSLMLLSGNQEIEAYSCPELWAQTLDLPLQKQVEKLYRNLKQNLDFNFSLTSIKL